MDLLNSTICLSDGFSLHPDGTIIAYGAGPCNGRGNSLRSEGAGMLAVTVLMSLISIPTSTDTIKLTCVSDNQELINRMNCHKDYQIQI